MDTDTIMRGSRDFKFTSQGVAHYWAQVTFKILIIHHKISMLRLSGTRNSFKQASGFPLLFTGHTSRPGIPSQKQVEKLTKIQLPFSQKIPFVAS